MGHDAPQLGLRDTVDAHVHVWDANSDDFPWNAALGVTADAAEPVDQLVSELDEAGVSRAVVVQSSLYAFDHRYLLSVLAAKPERFRGVALVDPLGDVSAAHVRALVNGAGITGLRMIPLRNDREWFSARVAQIWDVAGELNLAITFLAGPAHDEAIATWARRYPEVKVVIDHLGRPDLVRTDPTLTFDRILHLSENSNCYLKVSGIGGMSVEAYPYQDAWDWVVKAVRAFGARRLMWGSDFPYVKAYRSSIHKSLLSTRQALFGLPEDDVSLIVGGTAMRVFRLSGD